MDSTDFWKKQFHEKQKLHHKVSVQFSYGDLDPVINWSKDNLNGLWKWEMIQFPGNADKGKYIFHFEDDKDLEVFCLRWM